MGKITLRGGDYVLTEGLSDDVCKAIADTFVGAGARHCDLDYDHLGEVLGWDVRDSLLYTSSNEDYYRVNVFTGRCLTPEQVLGTVTQEWSGNGLPPIGEVCELSRNGKWQECEIIGHFEQPLAKVAAFTLDNGDGVKALSYATESCFRPIKTDEERALDHLEYVLRKNHHHISFEDTAKEIYNFLQEKA